MTFLGSTAIHARIRHGFREFKLNRHRRPITTKPFNKERLFLRDSRSKTHKLNQLSLLFLLSSGQIITRYNLKNKIK